MESITELSVHVDKIGDRHGELRLVTPRAEQQMIESIKRYGQMSPVVVYRDRDDGYELVDGFKRLRACRELGLDSLRVRVLAIGGRAAKAALLCLNWVAGSVSALEEGWVIHSLCRSDGLSQVEVAELLGRHKSWVCRRLSLVERLCDEVQSQLRLGLVTGTMARELARLPHGNQQRLLESIMADGLTSAEVGQIVELLGKADLEQQKVIMEQPRAVLDRQSRPQHTSDPRLGEQGNRVRKVLWAMTDSCARVAAKVESQRWGQLAPGELIILAPEIREAQRAGKRAITALSASLSTLIEKGNDDDL